MTPSDQYSHEIPFPFVLRALFFLIGAAACFLTLSELGRGVLPLNALSPFFAVIVGGGCFVGGAFMMGAIAGPSVVMTFSPGEMSITKTWPWGTSSERHPASAIRAMRVEIDRSTDGPDEWFVEITLVSGARLASRRFGGAARADAELKAFETALAGAGDAAPIGRA